MFLIEGLLDLLILLLIRYGLKLQVYVIARTMHASNPSAYHTICLLPDSQLAPHTKIGINSLIYLYQLNTCTCTWYRVHWATLPFKRLFTYIYVHIPYIIRHQQKTNGKWLMNLNVNLYFVCDRSMAKMGKETFNVCYKINRYTLTYVFLIS